MIRFALPDALSAAEPPEARGLTRDGVRLLVARAGAPVEHGRFTDLPAALEPGDLVVVNGDEGAVVLRPNEDVIQAVDTRIKMRRSSHVRIIAETSKGELWTTSRFVYTSLNGCV